MCDSVVKWGVFEGKMCDFLVNWGDFGSSFATMEREKRGQTLPLSIFCAKVCIELRVRALGVLGWMWTW